MSTVTRQKKTSKGQEFSQQFLSGTYPVCLVLTASQLAGSFYGDLFMGLTSALSRKGKRVLICTVAHEREVRQSAIDLVRAGRTVAVPGSIVQPGDSLLHHGAKVILLDCLESDDTSFSQVATIGFDRSKGIALAVRNLAAMGHRDIALFCGDPRTGDSRLVQEAFDAAMRKASLNVRPDRVCACAAEQLSSVCPAEIINPQNALSDHPSAAVCATDQLAWTLVSAIRQAGGMVPGSLSIIGCRKTAAEQGVQPLTSIEYHGRDMGKALAALVSDGPLGDTPHIILMPKLVMGESTAPRVSYTPVTTTASRLVQIRHPVPLPSSAPCKKLQPLPDGIYEFQAVHSGLLLDLPNRSETHGGTLWQWPRNGDTAQLWHITHVGDSWYTIRNAGTWLYLDADLRSLPITPVILNSRNDSSPDVQLWRFDPVDALQNTFRVCNRGKDLVLDVSGASSDPNAIVLVHPRKRDEDAANQHWLIVPVPFVSGSYEVLALHSGKALDVPGGSRRVGTVPCLKAIDATSGQRWELLHTGSGLYRIRNALAGLNLQATRYPSLAVILDEEDPDILDAQLWQIRQANASEECAYEIMNKALSLFLEIPMGTLADNVSVGLAARDDPSHQRWIIRHAS